MITVLVYLINAAVLLFFSARIFNSLKKKENHYLNYFLGAVAFYGLAFFVDAVILLLLTQSNNSDLFLADYIGRFFLYIGSMFAVQIPLYKFWPKAKARLAASAGVGIFALILSVYNFVNQNHPFVNYLGIVQWQASDIVGIGAAILIVGIWIPTSILFFQEYYMSKYKSMKSLYLGLGFLISSVAIIFNDFGSAIWQYVIINFFVLLGFSLIFVGLSLKEKIVA